MTALLGDFIFLFSFSALQAQESELFPVTQSMSGLGGLKSSVSFPYQTHKNQKSNQDIHVLCSSGLFLESLACGKHIIWRQAGPEGGCGKEASSGWGIFYLLGFSWPLEVLTSVHQNILPAGPFFLLEEIKEESKFLHFGSLFISIFKLFFPTRRLTSEDIPLFFWLDVSCFDYV